MVLTTIDALGATVIPCCITHYWGTTQVHHHRSSYTANSPLRARRIGAIKSLTIGSITIVHDTPYLTVVCHLQQGSSRIKPPP